MNSSKMEIVSLNVGKPKVMNSNGKEVISGIYKNPVDCPLYLSKLNFEGDQQADLVHHGGVDKAICVYPYEHYSYWEKDLNITLNYGAFGENLTVKGMTEDEVYIGDIFQLGSAVVQVSQPRQPCFKLAKRYNIKDLPLKFQNTGFTGFVLKEGEVEKNSPLNLLEADPTKISIQFANQIMHHDKKNIDAIKEILNVESLSTSWRNTFEKRLNGVETDPTKRLEG